MKIPEITPLQFYKCGMIAFLIIGSCSLFQLLTNILKMNIWAIISQLVFISFYFITAFFFNYLKKSIPKESVEFASNDIDDIIKQVKKK
jgi:hypothetical protein